MLLPLAGSNVQLGCCRDPWFNAEVMCVVQEGDANTKSVQNSYFSVWFWCQRITNRAAFASIVRKQHQLHVLFWALDFVLDVCIQIQQVYVVWVFFFLLILYSFWGKKVFQTVTWLLVNRGVRLCHCCSSDYRAFILFKEGETICAFQKNGTYNIVAYFSFAV